MDAVGIMRDNILKWLGRVRKKSNEDTVEKMDVIRVKKNREKGKPKKKWITVIR